MIRNCKKCNEDFETIIRGKTWREDVSHNRTYCFKCSPLGRTRSNVKDLPRPLEEGEKYCRKCKTIKLTDDFHNGGKKKQGYCKQCLCDTAKIKHTERKTYLVSLKGGKCYKCGYEKNVRALEFHHRDRSKKKYQVSGSNVYKPDVLEEMEKCDLLCANCHRELHDDEGYRYS